MDVQTCTIAVIDDDLRVRESLANLLASCGYEVGSYESSRQFLELDRLFRVSCTITDVQMRQMSGFGLLQHLKWSNCAVPVIIITGEQSEGSTAFYLENGAAGFFKKPVDGNALVELLSRVCS
jgi:FixJ family two-component response regulator